MEVTRMARSTDQMLARYIGEIEEKQQFIDGIVSAAEEKGDDLTEDQLELVTRARDRIEQCNNLMKPIEEAREISVTSSNRIASIAKFMTEPGRPKDVEYRSAGAYALDMWRSGLGNEEARGRLELYNRAASHQTTSDNPGLIPTPI